MKKAKNAVAKKSDEPLVERIEVSPETIAASLPRADAERFKAAWDHYENTPCELKIELQEVAPRKWAACLPGSDSEKAVAHIRRLFALGTRSTAFADAMLAQLMTLWEGNGGITSDRYNAALAILESQKPENELQAMLVVQMIAAHDAAIKCTTMLHKADFADTMNVGANLSNKFMRTFATQIECLAKLRRGGEQIVKYVHVHEGGQAVVAGTINQHGGRSNLESIEQPCGAEAIAGCASLPGSDASRNDVPIASDAERTMPHPWREVAGCAEGQP